MEENLGPYCYLYEKGNKLVWMNMIWVWNSMRSSLSPWPQGERR